MNILQAAPGIGGGEAPSCSAQPLYQLFVDGWFVKGWQCTMAGGQSSTLLVLSLIIFAAVGLSTFIATGSLAIPAVLGILLAGILFAILPATAVNIAVIALIATLSVGGMLITLRFGGR